MLVLMVRVLLVLVVLPPLAVHVRQVRLQRLLP